MIRMTDLRHTSDEAFVINEAGSPLTRTTVQPVKRTLAEELRLQLADDIVRGALEPGSSLDESEIARRFNVSRTPVREALRQLVASGLVNARAHRSAVVVADVQRDHGCRDRGQQRVAGQWSGGGRRGRPLSKEFDHGTPGV